MPSVFSYPGRTKHVWLLTALLATLAFSVFRVPLVFSALLHPLDGVGDFHTSVDVLNRWQDDGTLDLLILVEVANADLTFAHEQTGLVGRLRVDVQLEPLQGETITRKRPFRTPSLVPEEARSNTLHQVFGVVLRDVPVREGRLSVQVYDVKQNQNNDASPERYNFRHSQCSTVWVADSQARAAGGVALGDPLFLFHAPLKKWNPSQVEQNQPKGGPLYDFMHPSRRYGLEQDKLQLFIPVHPPEGGLVPGQMEKGLRVQITSLDLDFAINDTISFDRRGQLALEAGRLAGLLYELDINLLPEGSYRLGLAPLSGRGRGISSGFDVVWRLDHLGAQRHLLLVQGHLVFSGSDLKRFEAASFAEKEVMLDKFWADLNPDPESPLNAAYLEFQTRMAYVQQFLGGFTDQGPKDDRGLVLVLLGAPDEIQREAMPMNFRDQDDAQIKVFKRFAPDRESVGSKGFNPDGSVSSDPYQATGGIPMPYSERAVNQIDSQVNSANHNFSFELWKYDRHGAPLFDNIFSRSAMGSRFLFLDRTGSGDYYLESSNVIQGED